MNTITPLQVNRDRIKKINNLSPKNQNSPSFKGMAPATIIAEADREIMNVFQQHYGNIGERVGEKVGKLVTSSDVLKKASRFTLEKGITSIQDKTIPRAIAENAVFPFVNLPLYAASWATKQAQKLPLLRDKASKIYKKPLLRIPRKINELDEKTDIIKGIYEKTSETVSKFAKEKGVSKEYLLQQLNKTDDTPQAKQLVKEAGEYIKESLYKTSNKFFDKHTGNFNTAYERPLNRIVTGLIPVAFLANDAYNLSVLCGDSKEESKKEANARKRQEITRVGITAYIQLMTFGAFTKQVNTIPWFTPLTSAATVLFSEIFSRKRLGRPVFFLSKEKAKEINKNKEAENKETDNNEKGIKKIFSSKKEQAEAPKQEKTFNFVPEKEPQIFTSFKSASKDESKIKPETKKDNDNKSERKALINFDTFKKGVAILVTAGFVLSFLKNSSYTKNSKIVKGIENFGKLCKKKLYDPLAFKDFEISQTEFDEITKSLKDAGCEKVAQGHEFIKQKYQKTADGIIKMYKGSISSSKAAEAAKEASQLIKQAGSSISDAEVKQIEESIKTAIKLEGTSIAEMKYSTVAKKAVDIITNKKVNVNPDNIGSITDIISNSIAGKVETAPIQIETKLKPFVDIVTQPFKFIASAMKLPFKIVSTMIKMAVSPIEKKAAESVLGKAELNNFEKSIHKVVTEIYGEKSAKAGKTSQVVFANAMEQLQKRTMPYRKAMSAMEKARTAGNAVEIEKAQQALDKAKNDLLVYVNTAVEKSFNGVTQSSNKNTDLAMMSKLASSTVTSAFLVADNYNMVMLKSNGEDKDGAKEKANERIIQRLSALFYQALFINWFNATFRSTYNSSLKGMTAVAIPNTLTTEVLTRKSIGMPLGRKNIDELNALDEKNENRKGFAGKYFKFMRLLTGKKPLKDRLPKDKAKQEINNAKENKINTNILNSETTNLLDLYTKK